MHKILLLTVLAASILLGALIQAQPTSALAGWKAGRIINDSVFTSYKSMSASQIQSFLNSKVRSCDTNGQQLSEFGGPDLNNDGKVQRWEWSKSRYNQTKFTCLKNWRSSGGTSAAQVIYNKAQKYKISPKVLIVLLQKEQGLVTDTWPLNIQYKTATGYGCPDTAPCDSQYYGLQNQIDWAAKMFRSIMNDSPTWYTPYELGNNYIQYNPSSSCGGKTVYIENRATQALYNYTPYTPNKAALDAGWGSAHCGAYGNRNFFLYFKNWFGQPNSNASYGYSITTQELYSDSNYTAKIGTNTAVLNSGSVVYAKVVVKNTGNQVWYNEFLKLGTLNPKDRNSVFADPSWLRGQRPTRMQEDSVASGETATFIFKLTAPSVSYQEYTERFGVVIEGQRWLSGSLTYNLTVQDPNPVYSVENVDTRVTSSPSGRFVQNNATIESWQDNTFYVTVKIKNTGNRVLPANLTKIGTTSTQDRASVFENDAWLSNKRSAIAKEGTIKPGAVGTFSFPMTTPSAQPTGLTHELFGVVIEGSRWVAHDIVDLGINVGQRPADTLGVDETLGVGEYLVSSDDRFRLTLQQDGNLVLYSNSTGKALWHARTFWTNASELKLQTDGNLVLYEYEPARKALWHSRTYGAR